MKASCLWLLLIGSVNVAAHSAGYDTGIELAGAANNIVFTERWFLPVLGVLAGSTIYIACICLLGRVIGFNDLDRDQ